MVAHACTPSTQKIKAGLVSSEDCLVFIERSQPAFAVYWTLSRSSALCALYYKVTSLIVAF